MRTGKRRKAAILRIEALEDRTLPSFAALASVNQSLFVGPTVPHANSLQQSAYAARDIDTDNDDDDVQVSAAGLVAQVPVTLTDKTEPNTGAGPLANPAFPGREYLDDGAAQPGNVSDKILSPTPGTQPLRADRAPGDDDRFDNDLAAVLAGVPAIHAAVNYRSSPPPEAAAPGTMPPHETEHTAEPSRTENHPVATSFALDEFSKTLAEDGTTAFFVSAASSALPTDSEVNHHQPRTADLLMNALAPDMPTLDLAMQQFLSQFKNEAGHALDRPSTGPGWVFWTLGTVVTGLAALEFSARPRRRQRVDCRGSDDARSRGRDWPVSLTVEGA